MATTGYFRSITVVIDKTVAGASVPGYPKTYDGKAAFTLDGASFVAKTSSGLATMPVDEYTARLDAWKTFVQNEEPGLSIDETTVAGGEAYK
ncbi:MAG: hypothetical protein LBJ47_04815 [Tannerella sp.]|jgi:hypothetical protein|nr:hypothetical protein [Tannerella sp.]